jgi:hypothetical protein
MTKPDTRNSRIPATIQAFLVSTHGKDVNKLPRAEMVASKVFFRNCFFQQKAGSKSRIGIWSSKKIVNEEDGEKPAQKPVSVSVSLTETKVWFRQ